MTLSDADQLRLDLEKTDKDNAELRRLLELSKDNPVALQALYANAICDLARALTVLNHNSTAARKNNDRMLAALVGLYAVNAAILFGQPNVAGIFARIVAALTGVP